MRGQGLIKWSLSLNQRWFPWAFLFSNHNIFLWGLLSSTEKTSSESRWLIILVQGYYHIVQHQAKARIRYIPRISALLCCSPALHQKLSEDAAMFKNHCLDQWSSIFFFDSVFYFFFFKRICPNVKFLFVNYICVFLYQYFTLIIKCT